MFNDRIDPDDPPSFKAKDAGETAPTRLGVYADRDLAWGRYSALSRVAPSDSVAAGLFQMRVRVVEGPDPWHAHQEVPAAITDDPLNLALVVPLDGATKPIFEQVMGS